MASVTDPLGNLLLSSRQPLPEGLTDGDSDCNDVSKSLRKLSSSVVSCVTTLEASVASCVATAEASQGVYLSTRPRKFFSDAASTEAAVFDG